MGKFAPTNLPINQGSHRLDRGWHKIGCPDPYSVIHAPPIEADFSEGAPVF